MPVAEFDGVSLFYEQRGDGAVVLGIMGFALDQRFWAAQIPAVTRTHSFVTFDNRGVGRSTGVPVTTIDEMAEDAYRLLDHLEVERAVVFGVSMGGTIAQRLVLEHPDRVSALILAVTWARPIEFMRRQSDVARSIIRKGSLDEFIDATLVRMFTPRFFEVGGEVIDQMVRAFLAETGPEAASSEVLLAQLDAIDKHDVIGELGAISCPTLVLGGKMDMMVPGFASEEIAAAVPGAELVMFESGHGCMIEEMDTFNARVAAFLGSF